MGRDFVINGESLVQVAFGAHIPADVSNIPNCITNTCELGLAADKVTISPIFRSRDIKIDSFGPEVPVDVLQQLAECRIRMNLIHYDYQVLDLCVSESLGGVMNPPGNFPPRNLGTLSYAGVLPPAGTLMGAGVSYLNSGYHFMSLSVLSPVLNFPWHFPASYLSDSPFDMPLGAEKTTVLLNWRAIPYNTKQPNGEIISSGVTLFDHLPDDI